MSRYLFFKTADRGQDEIWRYTAELWGEDQADAYIHGLHKHLEHLADAPALWRPLPKHIALRLGEAPQVFVTRYGRHFIFFRRLSQNRVGVISILHERMDLPARLADDLKALL